MSIWDDLKSAIGFIFVLFGSLVGGLIVVALVAGTITAIATSLGWEPPDPHAEYMEICMQVKNESDCELRYAELKLIQDAIRHNNNRIDSDEAAIYSAGYGAMGY